MPWLQVLVSAGVAALVTLAIEYAAKPWLEVRKERILRGVRLREDVVTSLHLAHANFGMVLDMLRIGGTSPEHRDAVQVELRRLKDEMGEQSASLIRLGRLLSSDDPLAFEMVSCTAGLLLRVSRLGQAIEAEEEMNEGVAISLMLVADRRLRQRQLREEARAWLDEHLVN